MKSIHLFLTALFAASLLLTTNAQDKPPPLGYTDTPMLPHADWRVHDLDRPAPKRVMPGETPAHAPADAIVLFDGTNLDHFRAKDGTPSKWKLNKDDAYMEVVKGDNIWTKKEFGSCQLHLEWRSPTPVQSSSQKRGNSGVFLMDRYEIQVLDCHENPTYADGMAGSIYGQYPPLVNAVHKPGTWNTYDILFTAPTFGEDGKVLTKAYATVLLNGVVVQHHAELLGPCRHKKVATYKPHPAKAPLRLQDHRDDQAVRFRNIWIRPLTP